MPAELLDWERRAVQVERVAGVLHGSRGAIRAEFGYGPYTKRVMEFDFSRRGDEAERRRVGEWPAG